MSEKTSSLFDDLISGIVNTTYRFVGLTVGTLLIPFVKRTKHFWPAMIASESRLSSLSVFLIWTFCALSLITGDLKNVPSVLLVKQTNYPIIYILIITFVLVVIVDLSLRLCCLFIQNTVRRRLYMSVMRLCLSAIAFGAFADLEAELLLGRFPAAELFFGGLDLSPTKIQTLFIVPGFGGFPIIAVFLVALFALPLAVIINKVARVKSAKIAVLAMFGIMVFIPIILCNLALQVFFRTNSLVTSLLPRPAVHIAQLNTSCDAREGKVFRANSYLILLGEKSYVLTGASFTASINDGYANGLPVEKDIGTGSAEQSVIIGDSQFTPVQLNMNPSMEAPNLNESHFECSLSLARSLQDLEPMRIR